MKRNVLLGAAILLLFLSAASANRALIVSIGDYGHTQLNLNGPDRDAVLMKEVSGRLGFKREEIKTLLDQEAGRNAIINAINSWIVNGVGPEDTVLFYFSGHGMQVADIDGDEDDGCDEAIVPADMLASKGKSLIIDDELNQLLRRSEAKHILVFIDSCHSGTVTRGVGSSEFSVEGKRIFKSSGCSCNKPVNIKSLNLFNALTDKRMLVFTAAGQNEVALGGLKKGDPSVFTKAVHAVLSSSRVTTFAVFREQVAFFMRTDIEQYGLIYHTPYMECDKETLQSHTLGFAAGGRVPNRNPSADDLVKDERMKTHDRIVNNSRFKVHLTHRKLKYTAGERVHFKIKSSKPGYLNVIELDSEGKLVVLFPNKFADQNRINADQEVFVPEGIGGFEMVAQAPYGTSRVFALVTTRPLNMMNESAGRFLGQFKALDEIESDQVLTRAIGIVSGPARLQGNSSISAQNRQAVDDQAHTAIGSHFPPIDSGVDFGATVTEITVRKN